MIKIFRDGRLIQMILGNDVVVVRRQDLERSRMSAERFEEVYTGFVKECRSYEEAYEKAEVYHEQIFATRRYSDFESFRIVKNRKR